MAITLDDFESCGQRDNQSDKLDQLFAEIIKNMHTICMDKLTFSIERAKSGINTKKLQDTPDI